MVYVSDIAIVYIAYPLTGYYTSSRVICFVCVCVPGPSYTKSHQTTSGRSNGPPVGKSFLFSFSCMTCSWSTSVQCGGWPMFFSNFPIRIIVLFSTQAHPSREGWLERDPGDLSSRGWLVFKGKGGGETSFVDSSAFCLIVQVSLLL